MTAQLRSELRKLRTTRTNAGLLLGLVVLILFGVTAARSAASPIWGWQRTSGS